MFTGSCPQLMYRSSDAAPSLESQPPFGLVNGRSTSTPWVLCWIRSIPSTNPVDLIALKLGNAFGMHLSDILCEGYLTLLPRV